MSHHHRSTRRRARALAPAIALLAALALGLPGCSEEPASPFRPTRHSISGRVRLIGQLTNASGQWTGTRTVDDADGVPVDLEYGDAVVATTSTSGGAFRFNSIVQGGYRVRAHVPAPFSVRSSVVTLADADVTIPTPLTLESVGQLDPWPNPAGSATQTIDFELADTVFARVAILDPSGRRVRLLQSGPMNPGAYSARWAGIDSLGAPVTGRYYWITLEAYPSTAGPFDRRAHLLFR